MSLPSRQAVSVAVRRSASRSGDEGCPEQDTNRVEARVQGHIRPDRAGAVKQVGKRESENEQGHEDTQLLVSEGEDGGRDNGAGGSAEGSGQSLEEEATEEELFEEGRHNDGHDGETGNAGTSVREIGEHTLLRRVSDDVVGEAEEVHQTEDCRNRLEGGQMWPPQAPTGQGEAEVS